MSKLPSFDKINEGDTLPSITNEPITRIQLVKYAGASGDFNPIHTIPEYAKEAGLHDTIAHGMLIMGILGRMISGYAGISAVTKYNVQFKSMTNIGDILTSKGEVKKKYENETGRFIDCKVIVEDQKGEAKLEGKVTIKF